MTVSTSGPEEVEPVTWWKFDESTLSARAVTGHPDGWPHRDSDGNQMFSNTYFRTEEEAWQRGLQEAEAGVSLDAASYRNAKKHLQTMTQRLADTAAHLVDVKRAYADRKRALERGASDEDSDGNAGKQEDGEMEERSGA